MKQNPNSIEEQLKAAAEKRRAAQGEPFTLGQVERNALRQEVRTKWPSPRAQKAAWWDAFSGRLAWVSSIAAFALLVTGVLVRTGPRQEDNVASSAPSGPPPEATLRNATPTPQTEPVVRQQRFEQAQTGLSVQKERESASPESRRFGSDIGAAADSAVAPAPKPESSRPPSQLSVTKRAASTPAETKARNQAATLPAPGQEKDLRVTLPKAEATLPRTRTLSSAADSAEASAGARFYSFRDLPPNALYFKRFASTNVPVLLTFSMEKRDGTMVLRDADGSVYQGPIDNRDALTGGLSKLPESKMATNATFSVSGTNLTLGRLVQVRGVLNENVGSAAPARNLNVVTNRTQQRLTGTVQIQGRNPIPLDAVSDGQPGQTPAAAAPPVIRNPQ